MVMTMIMKMQTTDRAVRTNPLELISKLRTHLEKAIEIARERRALARLDDRMLRDIGLTEEQADREVRRAVWDYPINR